MERGEGIVDGEGVAVNPGGHISKFRQGCSSYFLGLKFSQILFF